MSIVSLTQARESIPHQLLTVSDFLLTILKVTAIVTALIAVYVSCVVLSFPAACSVAALIGLGAFGISRYSSSRREPAAPRVELQRAPMARRSTSTVLGSNPPPAPIGAKRQFPSPHPRHIPVGDEGRRLPPAPIETKRLSLSPHPRHVRVGDEDYTPLPPATIGMMRHHARVGDGTRTPQPPPPTQVPMSGTGSPS